MTQVEQMPGWMEIFVETKCPHCGRLTLRQVQWITFATSLHKGLVCPVCGLFGISTWQEIERGAAMRVIEGAILREEGFCSPAHSSPKNASSSKKQANI